MRLPREAYPVLLLGGLAFALGAVLWSTRDRASSGELMARENNLFITFSRDQLTRLTLGAAPERRGWTLRKNARAGYSLGENGGPEAEPAAVDELLRALDFASWIRRIDAESVDLDSFGFRAPRAELTLESPRGTWRLLIGGPAPTPVGSSYAEVRGADGTPSFGVVSDELLRRVAVDERAFRGGLLLPYAKSELRELSLRGPSGEISLVADSAGFRLGAGGPRADRDTVDRALFQLARVTAGEFLDDAAAERAQAGATERVLVREVPRQGAAVVVTLGGACPGHDDQLIVRRTEPDRLASCFARNVLTSLDRAPAHWQDVTLSPLNADELDHVLVRSPRGTVELVRKNAAFELRGSQERAVALEPGNAFLTALTETRGTLREQAVPSRPADGSVLLVGASPWASGAPRGNDAELGAGTDGAGTDADATDRAIPSDGHPEVRTELDLWFEADRVVVLRKDDGQRLEFARGDVWFLEGDPSFARDKVLAPARADRLVALHLSTQDGAQLTLRSSQGAWQLAEPRGYSLDQQALSAQLRELTALPVERFVAEAPDLRPRTRWELEESDGTRRVLTLGQRVAGGYLARLDGEASAFVLAPQTARLLEGLPLDSSSFYVDPHAVEELELSTPQGTWKLRRSGERLVSSGGLASAELGDLLSEALLALKPLGVAHLGKAAPSEGLERPVLRLRAQLVLADGTRREVELAFGSAAPYPGAAALWARDRAIDATYFVDHAAVQQLLDAL
ncbi:MAG TPA: DUF4340 domain-containing protein [Polyangiaceae bacterium]|nr:DUF4340 domain-containing protein [Polyangiaceae bacterium]